MSETNMSKFFAELWKTYLPPLRPSVKFLQVYEEHIRLLEGRENPEVLILGATPELRMMALNHDANVTVVDINKMVIEAMDELMDYTNLDKDREITLNSNWLDMPLQEDTYDLILGDGSINELKRAEYETLLIKLKHILKPRGYVSMKIQLPYSDEREPMAMLDVLEDYKTQPAERKTNILSDLLLRLAYTSEVYDKASSEWSAKRIMDQLRKLHDQRKIEDVEFEALDDFFEFPEKWGYEATLPRRSELELMLNKHFSIVSSTPGEETWFLDSRVYLLKPTP